MKVTVIKPVTAPGGFPAVINLEPHEASLLCEFFSRTNRAMEAKLLGEDIHSTKIAKLDQLLFDLYESLHKEGY